MSERRFVGGPWDGRLIDTELGVFRVPLPPDPIEVVRKVVPFRRQPTIQTTDYYRVGNVYRWEGLVEDAWSSMDVSEEVAADGGPMIRSEIRRQMRSALTDLAKDKQLGRIVWRRTDSKPFMQTWRALVGPRAVEFGLRLRAERRDPTLRAERL